jgi:hypothetical protein
MFNSHSQRSTNKQICKEAIGPSKEVEFQKKLSWLQSKWKTDKEYPYPIEIHQILFGTTKPIYDALIADNLDYFQKAYIKEKDRINKGQALDFSCLCGSKEIANFLLEELKIDYLSDDQIVDNICSSPNLAWALQVVEIVAKSGKTMPMCVYRLDVPFDLMEKTIQLFDSNKKDGESKYEENFPRPQY